MACSDMCLTLPNLDPVGSELESVTSVDDEENPYSFPLLPRPTPTDFANLFQERNPKPHSRKSKPGHVPRPRNAFILFRCDFVKQRVPDDVINDHRDLSRLAGCIWRKMSDIQKRPWFEKAEVEKRWHSEAFPQYRYTPIPGDRPKRVYRRKKAPIPEEIILLKDPHSPTMWRPTNDPPNWAPPTTSPNSASRLTPLIHEDHSHSRQNSRQNHPRYRPKDESLALGYLDDSEGASLTPPSAFCGGFVNVPQEGPNLVSWEFTPPDSSPCDQSGYWPISTSSRSNDTIYFQPPSNNSTSLQDSDTLYDIWKDLGQFHGQGFQESLQQPNSYEPPAPCTREDFFGSHYVPFVPTSAPFLGASGLYRPGCMPTEHEYPVNQSP